MKYFAAIRVLLVVAAASLVAGCQADPTVGGDAPGVIAPDASSSSSSSPRRPLATTRIAPRAIARVDDVTIDDAQLIDLLYESNGLDALLKLVQLNMAKAAAQARGLGVSGADVNAERKLTMSLAFPGQDEGDYDNLLRQLLQQQRISRAEFEVVMETNANLRAIARQSSSDVTAEQIEGEFNLLYGERVRVRDIPVSNMQEVGEVQRMLALPGAQFEDVASKMGKIPALRQLGGLLPEFARTSTGYSAVFIEAAFALQPGQVSTDPIHEGSVFHVIKLEDKLPPRAVKLADVRDSVREQLIVRRANVQMNDMRGQLAQRAVRELKIDNAAMQAQFDARVAAANPKPADKREVQRSLEEQNARATTAPAFVGPGDLVGTGATTQPASNPVR